MKLLSIMTSTRVHKGIVYVSGMRLNSASSSSQGRQSLKSYLLLAPGVGSLAQACVCCLPSVLLGKVLFLELRKAAQFVEEGIQPCT